MPGGFEEGCGKANLGEMSLNVNGGSPGSSESDEKYPFKHFNISIGIPHHPDSLSISDSAPHTPPHRKLLHNACIKPPTFGGDTQAETR